MAGPENLVNPFPVPPKTEVRIPLVIFATSKFGRSAATKAANWRALAPVERNTKLPAVGASREKVSVAEAYKIPQVAMDERPVPHCTTVTMTSPNSDHVCPGFGAAEKTTPTQSKTEITAIFFLVNNENIGDKDYDFLRVFLTDKTTLFIGGTLRV